MTTPSTTTPAAPTTTTKVFVGNLSFQTRESDLAHAFEVATEGKGKVLSANIITRGQRSLGFGFVEFDTAAAAEASVQALHRKELDGRPINVEVARPRAAGAPASAPAGAAPVAGEQQQRRPPRGPRRGPQQPPMFGGYPVPPYGFNPRGQPMMMVPPQFMAAAPYGMPQQQQPFRRGPPRQPRPQRERAPENRPLSSATLFVGNLPFVVDDANLKDIFADLHVKEAHVVRTLQGRSKGYGFVEFENEDARAKALASLDKIEVEGRVLVLKPAMVPPTVTKKAEAPAAAPAPATPATPAAVPK